jgi:hypothetical protein
MEIEGAELVGVWVVMVAAMDKLAVAAYLSDADRPFCASPRPIQISPCMATPIHRTLTEANRLLDVQWCECVTWMREKVAL